MKEIPELWELIALFEMEPVYVYGEEKGIPWFYSTINFKLKRGSETLDITISPANGIIDIWLLIGDRKIIEINLENVEGMKIEKIHNKEILHILFSNDDVMEKFYIETKPQIYMYCSKARF
ncbi:hypothetical protein [Clostridium saccharobutylicum]|nr:hypothetical protein [Clostridium saccharobutylicum]AQR91818.1 hypothetical protein CLOSC_35460 [Clostridium saccharobutylicum]AQS01720.1 hypothetical protein CSACC_35510 [Clostridium saccharobutylicum]AQS11326.1 hypothetical protein CLOBY_34820 [Clostridium saccharobutylicum]AQS15703.1 hypothetical protein CLOSACC_35510 [Clostridium saccharobutylicum]MBA2907482.1 hypothetical protein [Clostridium saccharobutylicum]